MRLRYLWWAIAVLVVGMCIVGFRPFMLHLIVNLAEGGHAGEQYRLGTMYAKGEVIEKDPTEALKWHMKSAEQGEVRAQYALAAMYMVEEDVEKDETEAKRWLTYAAEQGYARAQGLLGSFYLGGDDREGNPIEAYKWFTLSASDDSMLAEELRDAIMNDIIDEEEITEAKRRAAEFRPKTWEEIMAQRKLVDVSATEE
jgi:TPR repeat protein